MQILGKLEWNIKNCAILNMRIEMLNTYIYLYLHNIKRTQYPYVYPSNKCIVHSKNCFTRDYSGYSDS